MQEVEILKEQIGLKKRQRFMLRASTNLQIKRQSKKMKLTQNAYLTHSLLEFLDKYRYENIFFHGQKYE